MLCRLSLLCTLAFTAMFVGQQSLYRKPYIIKFQVYFTLGDNGVTKEGLRKNELNMDGKASVGGHRHPSIERGIETVAF
jgi:hypothetical protein